MKKKSVIEDLFSIRKNGIWKNFAHELNAEFIDQGFFLEDKLLVEHKGWTVLIDVYLSYFNLRIPNTRITAICKEKQPLDFQIQAKSRTILPRIRTIKTKKNQINNMYYVGSSNEDFILNLLKEERIEQPLMQLDELSLRYDKTASLPFEGVIYPKLQHTELGYVRDVAKLKSLVGLFIETLEYLSQQNIIEKVKNNP